MAVVSVLCPTSAVAVVVTVRAAATVWKPLSTSAVASATCIVLAVSEELDFSDKTLMKLVNEMSVLVNVSHMHHSSENLAKTKCSAFELCASWRWICCKQRLFISE